MSAVSLVRRIALPGFALLLLCGCASHERPVSVAKMSQPRAARELRVMTFNLRVRTILDGPNIWDRRRELVVQRVRAFDPEIAHHPAREYYERGIPLSINTDDPQLFGTSLAEEYAALCRDLGFSRLDIRALIEQGVQTSWLPAARKSELLDRIRLEMAALEPT